MPCRRVICYGGRGGLGSVCVDYFKKHGYWVCSIDLKENLSADCNILIEESESASGQQKSVSEAVSKVLNNEKVDGIFCVAGGWAGGNAAHKEFVRNMELMWKQSVWSSTIAASLAASYLSGDGIFVLSGAHAAISPTPGMIGYGLAKAAVHHLTQSLAQDTSGLPAGATIAAIAPVILDTPMNRKWMPKADRSTWTPLEEIAQLFLNWTEGINRPKSGSIVQLLTKDGQTDCVPL